MLKLWLSAMCAQQKKSNQAILARNFSRWVCVSSFSRSNGVVSPARRATVWSLFWAANGSSLLNTFHVTLGSKHGTHGKRRQSRLPCLCVFLHGRPWVACVSAIGVMPVAPCRVSMLVTPSRACSALTPQFDFVESRQLVSFQLRAYALGSSFSATRFSFLQNWWICQCRHDREKWVCKHAAMIVWHGRANPIHWSCLSTCCTTEEDEGTNGKGSVLTNATFSCAVLVWFDFLRQIACVTVITYLSVNLSFWASTIPDDCNRLTNVALLPHAAAIHFSKCVALIQTTKAKKWRGWCVAQHDGHECGCWRDRDGD